MFNDPVRWRWRLSVTARLLLALGAGSVWLMPEEFPWWVLLTSSLIAVVFLAEAISKYRRGTAGGEVEHSSPERRP